MKRRTLALASACVGLVAVGGVIAVTATDSVAADAGWKNRTPAEPIHDDRDQYALVAEIIEARGKHKSEAAPALDAVKSSWFGHRYTWEVALVPALCRDGATCVAMPFDHLRNTESPIIQGWLPRVQLDHAAHAELLERCKPHKTCVFTFEGRLDRLVLTPEDPISVGFSEVEIVGTRAATSAESWIVRPRAKRFDPRVGGPRTQERAQ